MRNAKCDGGCPRLLGPALASLSGFLLFASFPPLEWADAAWFALVPLLGAIYRACHAPDARGLRPWQLGFLAGAVCWLLSVFWLTRVTVPGWLVLSCYCALYLAVFGWLCGAWFARHGVESLFANAGFMMLATASWVGLEFVRGTFATGFAWNFLGVSQFRNPLLIQSAAWGGVYSVSALVVWVNTGLGLTALRYVATRGVWGRRLHAEIALGLAALLAAFGHGLAVVRAHEPGPSVLRLALIQPAIPQDEKWDEAKSALIYERLDALTRQAQIMRPDLVIWPETALPDFLLSSETSYDLVYRLATNGSPILVGSMDLMWPDQGPPVAYNSSFLYDGDGALAGQYDKRHLVIFGEYVPFQNALPFLKALTPIPESFAPGSTSTVFHLEKLAAPFSALICFEDTVPRLARESVRNGARLLINQTNDAWFDPHAASRQHMANGLFRCVENRVPAVRVCNTGVTCAVDPLGRITDILTDEEGGVIFPGFLIAEVAPASDTSAGTAYTYYGDAPAAACATATGLFLVWCLRLRHVQRAGLVPG